MNQSERNIILDNIFNELPTVINDLDKESKVLVHGVQEILYSALKGSTDIATPEKHVQYDLREGSKIQQAIAYRKIKGYIDSLNKVVNEAEMDSYLKAGAGASLVLFKQIVENIEAPLRAAEQAKALAEHIAEEERIEQERLLAEKLAAEEKAIADAKESERLEQEALAKAAEEKRIGEGEIPVIITTNPPQEDTIKINEPLE